MMKLNKIVEGYKVKSISKEPCEICLKARSSCNGLISYEQIPDNDLGELNANRKMDRQKARHRTSPCLWVLGHGTCAETAKPKMGPKVLQGNIYWMP
uniref:Uncharacterized protein n=1 Tax=Trichogramma kaykai TaxID=54128 RepID=A0ABD2WGK7_9HYME